MDAIELLKRDHRRIEQVFSAFLDIETPRTQEELIEEIQTEVNGHVEAEERAFYSALRRHSPAQVDKALKRHSCIKETLVRLLDTGCNEELFLSLFNQLLDNLRRHVEEEEGPGGLMEVARKKLDRKALLKIGAAIEALKTAAEGELAA